jgi:hypothetical protein
MNLLPGYPLVVAPFFHLNADWPARLLVSAGVAKEQGRFVPRPPWRAPTADEMAVLVPDFVPANQEELDGGLSLFALPEHLQSTWWDIVARSLQGFDAFVRDVAELLAFKGLAVPEGAHFDLVASKPGQPSLGWNAAGTRPEGLAFDQSREGRVWGGINLGDEAVSVVLVNLAAKQMHDLLAGRFPDVPAAANLDELGERFLTHLPDYPPVRLCIEPGEGYRLPAGILVDACTLDATEPALLLMIREPGS